MAEQNPIKYSDLIAPDDSIEKLIGQLETLLTAYNGVADAIKKRANELSESLKSLSGATEEYRASTKKAAGETEDLGRTMKIVDNARNATMDKIRAMKELVRQQDKEEDTLMKNTVRRNRSAEGSYDQLAAQYNLNKQILNAMSAEMRKNTDEGKKLEEETRKIYEEMKKLQEATGKHVLNVGNYAESLKSVIGLNTTWLGKMQQIAELTEGGLTAGLKNAGAAVGTLGKQMLALLANPIVATIAAIAAAFMALAKGISSSEENTETLQRVLAPFQRVLTGIVSLLQDAAGFLLKGVEGMEKLAMSASRLMEKLPLVGGAFEKVNDEIQKNINLTKAKIKLEDDLRDSEIDIAAMERNIAKWRSQAAAESDPKKRIQLNKMAAAQESLIMSTRLRLAREEVRQREEEAKQAGNSEEANDKLAQSKAKLYRIEKEYWDGTRRINKAILKDNEKIAKDGENARKAQEEERKKELQRQQSLEDARANLYSDEFTRERAQIVAQYKHKIELLEGSEKYITEMTLALEQERDYKLAELFEKEAKHQAQEEEKEAKARIERQKLIEESRANVIKYWEDKINQQYELDASSAELEQSENKKTQMRLEAEKKRLAALLALYEKDGKTLTETELQILRNGMALVDQEIAKNKKGRDVYDMLGLSLDDDQKQAISDSFSFALDQLSSYLDAWVQAAEQKAQLAAKDVENAQNVLDAEREARAQGYASNVAQAQKELDLAKKTQQKALAEQEKAQRAQEMLATVQQATNLISATALIWSQLGFPWAIPATAIMWGAFAAAKIKAMQVTRSGSEQYGEGTVELLQGGSHQSGNDIDLGRKKDGTRRRAEGGEFFAVINKRNSRKFRDIIPSVIGALNDGTFAQKYMKAYDGGGMSVMVDNQSPDLRGLSSDVKTIREQGETRTYSDAQGTHIIHKNLHRIILN